MSAAQGGPQPDLYQTLGVDRDASREQVVRAWRRRARAEHPDVRPGDPAAPARFRALAEAYHVLADPGRRAAYDRASGYRPGPRPVVPGSEPGQTAAVRGGGAGAHAAAIPVVRRRVPGAWLRAGPVWIEPAGQPPAGAQPQAEGEAVLAELLLRYAGWRGRPW